MNRIIAIIILLFLSPLLLIIGLFIYLEDGSPIIFKQSRLGVNNVPFVFYKFRTMHRETPQKPTDEFQDAKNYVLKTGRILRITSLDELPNLINVLKGDMNFVGYRPAQEHESILNDLRKSKQVEIVKPGITGLAQINGRDRITLEKKVEYDSYYSHNHSFAMDMKIIIITFFKLLHYSEIKH